MIKSKTIGGKTGRYFNISDSDLYDNVLSVSASEYGCNFL